MKKLLLLVILTIIIISLCTKIDRNEFTVSQYMSDNVLDMGRPVDVNIDLDLLKRLDPAYEQ